MFRKTCLLIAALLFTAAAAFADGASVQFLLGGLSRLSGNVISYGRVHTYTAGTTTPKALYADKALTSALTNPATLDEDGRLVAYGSGLYKFIIKDASGNTIFTADNVEINSLAEILSDASDPFGTDLTQTNLDVTNLTVASATVTNLSVINSIALNNLAMNFTEITEVATGSTPTSAANLGQVEALIASYTPDTAMALDGSNASTSVSFPGTLILAGTPAMKNDGSNASTSVAFPGTLTVNGKTLMTADAANAVMGQDLSMANYKVTSLATGTAATDAVNKGQMEKAISEITPGTINHADLDNLAFADSGHTGFAKETGDATKTFEAAGITLASETMTRISNIRIAAPSSPQNGDIWIETP